MQACRPHPLLLTAFRVGINRVISHWADTVQVKVPVALCVVQVPKKRVEQSVGQRESKQRRDTNECKIRCNTSVLIEAFLRLTMPTEICLVAGSRTRSDMSVRGRHLGRASGMENRAWSIDLSIQYLGDGRRAASCRVVAAAARTSSARRMLYNLADISRYALSPSTELLGAVQRYERAIERRGHGRREGTARDCAAKWFRYGPTTASRSLVAFLWSL